jgi:hypothetical protein
MFDNIHGLNKLIDTFKSQAFHKYFLQLLKTFSFCFG